MIADAHGTIERGLLSDRVLLLIEKLPGGSAHVDVPVRDLMLVRLHGTRLCTPGELAGIVGVQLAVERRVVGLMISRRVDTLGLAYLLGSFDRKPGWLSCSMVFSFGLSFIGGWLTCSFRKSTADVFEASWLSFLASISASLV